MLNIIPQRNWKFQGEQKHGFCQDFPREKSSVFHPAVQTLTGRTPRSSHLWGVDMLFVAMEAEEERGMGVTLLGTGQKAREIKITNLLPAMQSPVCIAPFTLRIPSHLTAWFHIWSRAKLVSIILWDAPFSFGKHLPHCPTEEVLSQPGHTWSSTIMQKPLSARAAAHEELQGCHTSFPSTGTPSPAQHPWLSYQHRTQLSISQENFILSDADEGLLNKLTERKYIPE